MAIKHYQDPNQTPGSNSPRYRTPELPVAMFSFLLHFVWEFLQVPTYSGMAELAHWQGIKLCTSATIGDVGFALTAFWAASLAAGTRHWIGNRTALPTLVFIATGLALTVGFEFYYTQVTQRWTYSDLMPLVPPFGTGLSPLIQWIVIPPVVLFKPTASRRGRHRQRPQLRMRLIEEVEVGHKGEFAADRVDGGIPVTDIKQETLGAGIRASLRKQSQDGKREQTAA